MAYIPQFETVVQAVESLQIFPDTINEFITMIKERYRKKHSARELEWIDRLCNVYKDNCYNYVKFLKRVIAVNFLTKCLTVEDDVQRRAMVKELKAYIEGARDRLNKFLGPNSKSEVLGKVDAVLQEMEAIQAKKDKQKKLYLKFSEWLKGKMIAQVAGVFAKVIGPLWDQIVEHAGEAVKSDYDHDTLKKAISSIEKQLPQMETSLEQNRKALDGLEAVMNVLEREDADGLKKQLFQLHPEKIRVENACDKIMQSIDNLS